MESKWKYNKEKHSADEQDILKWRESTKETKLYKELVASLRSIPVSGTVSWIDGEDLEMDKDFWILSGAAIPIKQEQPQPFDFDKLDKDIKEMFPMENQSQEQQPIQTDNELRDKIIQILKEDINYSGQLGTYVIHGAIEKLESLCYHYAESMAALSQQPEHTQSELIAYYIHTIDSLNKQILEMGERIVELEAKEQELSQQQCKEGGVIGKGEERLKLLSDSELTDRFSEFMEGKFLKEALIKVGFKKLPAHLQKEFSDKTGIVKIEGFAEPVKAKELKGNDSDWDKDLIIEGIEEGSEMWKAEYDNCRKILETLVELKNWKDQNINMQAYDSRKPAAWETARIFLEQYQHQ